MNSEELLDAYFKADLMLCEIMFLTKHNIPIEEWPEELQGISGLNDELLGKP